MAAKPLLGIFDLGKYPKALHRLEHAVMGESRSRPCAANDRVKIVYAGFFLGSDATGVFRTRCRQQFCLDAELLLQNNFEILAELVDRRDRDDDLCFIFCRLDGLVPFRRPPDFAGCNQRRDGQTKKNVRDKNWQTCFHDSLLNALVPDRPRASSLSNLAALKQILSRCPSAKK